MSDILVAYFSATGRTRRPAEALAEAAGADLLEIVPALPYTAADLDWSDPRSRSSREGEDERARPALARACAEAGRHRALFIGFPIWWGVEPRVVDTFLESLTDATEVIVPFATSGGSGIGGAVRRIRGIADASVVRDGILMNRVPAREELALWAAGRLSPHAGGSARA